MMGRCFIFESAKVFDANHEEITNQGKLTIDKDKNLIKWVPNDISNIYGKTYIMKSTLESNKIQI